MPADADADAQQPTMSAARSSEPQLRFGLQFQVGAVALLEALCLLFSISTITSTCTYVQCLECVLSVSADSFNLVGVEHKNMTRLIHTILYTAPHRSMNRRDVNKTTRLLPLG